MFAVLGGFACIKVGIWKAIAEERNRSKNSTETIIDFLKEKATANEDTFLLPQDFILERDKLEAKYGVEFTKVLLKTIYDNVNLIKE